MSQENQMMLTVTFFWETPMSTFKGKTMRGANTSLQQQIPREAYGRVASWDWMGSTALRPIGLAVAGPLAAALGTRPVLVGGAAFTVASLLCLVAVPEVRAIRSTGPATGAIDRLQVGPEPLPEDQALEM